MRYFAGCAGGVALGATQGWLSGNWMVGAVSGVLFAVTWAAIEYGLSRYARARR